MSTPDLSAKAGRLYVINTRYGRYVGHKWDDDRLSLLESTVDNPRHARKFSSVGDAVAWIHESPCRQQLAEIQPYDDPQSVDSLLADQAARLRDRERIAWVAGEKKPEGNGVAATNGVAS
jgi:hypothetical protein